MMKQMIDEDASSVDRWLVSYADFMTLLFAFFVVMYSVSQVNEGKYRLLSHSLLAAFQPIQSKNKEVEIISDLQKNSQGTEMMNIFDKNNRLQNNTTLNNEWLKQGTFTNADDILNKQDALISVKQQLENSFSDLIEKDWVNIELGEKWLEINLKSALLFKSGSDQLESNAKIVLNEVAQYLLEERNLISVRGHTDNLAVNKARFSSNWDLSSARSVAVAELLEKQGVEAVRLMVEGFGSIQPIASNETLEGRAKNRRVTIAVSRDQLASIQDTQQKNTSPIENFDKAQEKQQEVEFDLIRLPNGALLIRGKDVKDDIPLQKNE